MMNEDAELLRQFIPEARDLLEQAGSGLLAIERNPSAREGAIIGVFRAVHTLKGTSGLFAVTPLTRVAHASEDLLGAFRASHLPFPSEAADVLFATFDQVGHWIDALEKVDALPPDAPSVAEEFVALLRGMRPATEFEARRESNEEDAGAWTATLSDAEKLRCRAEGKTAPLVALEYRPDKHCFFRGEDPALLIRKVPGLRVLRVEPAEPWAPIEALDPFICNFVLRAIAATDAASAREVFGMSGDMVRIDVLSGDWPRALTDTPPTSLQAIVTAQCELLNSTEGVLAPFADRVAAAEVVLREALRDAGLDATIGDVLSQCAAASLSEANPSPLLAFCAEILALGPRTADPLAQPEVSLDNPSGGRPSASPTLKVEQGRVDELMTLVGELVVAKNSLAYLASKLDSGEWEREWRDAEKRPEAANFVGTISREIRHQQAQFNRIAEDMQAAVMAVRMCPLSQVFQRFPRLVRDQSRRLNKEIQLVVEGEHTEADKNIVEALADPLIHMIRNSLDHGFELPVERLAAGKPRQGLLRLTAEQENDNVIVRLIDDGRGIDPELVRRRAVATGLLDPGKAVEMSEEQLIQLAFEPGFSTSETVSDLSGRGVGMDAARSAVEKLGGQVSLESKVGQGTVVTLSLPLTLAVTRIMSIEAGGRRLFGIPMNIIVETVRISRQSIRKVRNAEMFTLRDSVVPLVRLNRMLDLPFGPPRDDDAVLVVRIGGERLGIAVDAFREVMEVIVKPMEGALAELRGFSGTTLLGDGRVLLILDLRELV